VLAGYASSPNFLAPWLELPFVFHFRVCAA
jgi:hypothetical protein